MKLAWLYILLVLSNWCQAQPVDSLALVRENARSVRREFNLAAGLAVSPQMVFLGALDAGPFLQAESFIRGSAVSMLGIAEIRNKWLHLPMQSPGYNGKGLRSVYSLNALFHAGVGYTFFSRKTPASNSFYLIVTPGLFMFRDRVTNTYFSNTVGDHRTFVMGGLAWSTSKINKRGRLTGSQFYIPVFGAHLLENLRNMTVKFWWSLYSRQSEALRSE